MSTPPPTDHAESFQAAKDADDDLQRAEERISACVRDVQKCRAALDVAHEQHEENPSDVGLSEAIERCTKALEMALDAELEARLAGDRAYHAARIANKNWSNLTLAAPAEFDTEDSLAKASLAADDAYVRALQKLTECERFTETCTEALEVAQKKHDNTPIGVSLSCNIEKCMRALEAAQDAETQARLAYDGLRKAARIAKAKWERFVDVRGAEFRKRVRSFGGETVKYSEGLGYSPTSPSYTPDHSPPPMDKPSPVPLEAQGEQHVGLDSRSG